MKRKATERFEKVMFTSDLTFLLKVFTDEQSQPSVPICCCVYSAPLAATMLIPLWVVYSADGGPYKHFGLNSRSPLTLEIIMAVLG